MRQSRTGHAWFLGTLAPIAAALGLSAIGCGAPEPVEVLLRVAGASDLQGVLPELGAAFTRTTGSKIRINLTFGASGQLAEQIKAGAPFDVLLSADRKFVDDLAAGGFVRRESVAPYARGTLVLAVRRESRAAIEGLADLKQPEVKRIALANPALAPYGAAGKQALERAGLWPDVASKIVQAESVRQAYQFVESGNAEAGLVSKASIDVLDVRVIEVDPGLHDPIIQALGIATRSKLAADSEAFGAFVRGPEGQKILNRHGFQSP